MISPYYKKNTTNFRDFKINHVFTFITKTATGYRSRLDSYINRLALTLSRSMNRRRLKT